MYELKNIAVTVSSVGKTNALGTSSCAVRSSGPVCGRSALELVLIKASLDDTGAGEDRIDSTLIFGEDTLLDVSRFLRWKATWSLNMTSKGCG